jgi:cobalt/nickel transport system permease protein
MIDQLMFRPRDGVLAVAFFLLVTILVLMDRVYVFAY